MADDGQVLQDNVSAFEQAFIDRFHRKPANEREFKILPMIYFQQQTQIKRSLQAEKKATVIQAWVRQILQRRQASEPSEPPLKSPAASILRNCSTPKTSQRVHFDIPDSEGTKSVLTVEKRRLHWEDTKHRLKGRILAFQRSFEEANGRRPTGSEWQPVQTTRQRYILVTKNLERVKQLQLENSTGKENQVESNVPATVHRSAKLVKDGRPISTNILSIRRSRSPCGPHRKPAIVTPRTFNSPTPMSCNSPKFARSAHLLRPPFRSPTPTACNSPKYARSACVLYDKFNIADAMHNNNKTPMSTPSGKLISRSRSPYSPASHHFDIKWWNDHGGHQSPRRLR